MDTSPSAPLPLWICEHDGRGNRVAKEVIEAAHKIWGRVLRYVRSETDDLASAAEVLETTCHCVSRALHRATERNPVRSLDSYLYWAFVRRFNREMARAAKIQYVGSVEIVPKPRVQASQPWAPTQDEKIEAMQFLSHLDPRIRTMVIRRHRGDSWAEIGQDQGVSGHAAEMQFARAVKKTRIRLDALGKNSQRNDEK
jgi:DNA-directed RNA polymerase specialized sigma24 family protein